VAAKTEFVFTFDRLDDAARRSDAFDAGQRAGHCWFHCGLGVGRMRVMAISAGYVARIRIDRVFIGLCAWLLTVMGWMLLF